MTCNSNNICIYYIVQVLTGGPLLPGAPENPLSPLLPGPPGDPEDEERYYNQEVSFELSMVVWYVEKLPVGTCGGTVLWPYLEIRAVLVAHGVLERRWFHQSN